MVVIFSSLPIWILLIFFGLNMSAMARTSLNRSTASGFSRQEY